MLTREKTIDGVKYVLHQYPWGDEVDIIEQCLKVEVDGELKVENIRPKISTGKLQVLQLTHSLKSWEYRGMDSSGELKMEGDILEINEESVRSLPVRHGKALIDIARELNEVDEVERKK